MSRDILENGITESGLLNNSKPVFLAFAKIRKPHALQGVVAVEILSDFPDHYQEGDTVYVGDKHEKLILRSIRKAGKGYLIAFQDHNSKESVERFRNKLIFVKSESLPELDQNEYFHHDLIGIKVYDVNDKIIGSISEIISTGANDVFVIRPSVKGEKEILLPAIRSVIREVDQEKGKITVVLPEWL